MPDLHTNFIEAMRAAVKAAWTDCTVIVEEQKARRIPGEAAFTPPFAVLQVPVATESTDFPAMAAEIYQCEFPVLYVGTSAATEADVRSNLKALRDYLEANGLTTGQVLDEGWAVVEGGADELSAVLMEKAVSNRAGALVVPATYGEF